MSTQWNEVNSTDEQEINDIIQKLKNNKNPGSNYIMAKFIWEKTKEKRNLSTNKKIWVVAKMPNNWSKVIIVPLFKHGDVNDCKKYRGIAVLDMPYTVLAFASYKIYM